MLNERGGNAVAVLGGSGFVGRALVRRLVATGIGVRVLTRDRTHTRALWTLPAASCLEVDVYDEVALAAALAGCSAVVNLVGILNERRDDGRGFERAHVALTQVALLAAQRAGVQCFLQMSALNAALDAPSHYLRSKARGEALVVAATGMRTAILRPSVIFGPDDGLFTRFAALTKYLPWLPLAGATARFQPVYLEDVVAAMLRVLARPTLTSGLRLDLGGPEIWTLRAIAEYAARLAGHRCSVWTLGPLLGRLQAEFCEHLPGKPFSRDNWRSLQLESVVPGENGLPTLGIKPTAIDAVMPGIWRSRGARDRYAELRQRAHR